MNNDSETAIMHPKLYFFKFHSYPFCVSLVTQWWLNVPNIWTPKIPYRRRKNSKKMETLQICSPDRLQSRRVKCHCFHMYNHLLLVETIIKRNARDSFVLQNVGYPRARKLEAEVDPEGPDHNERSRDSQHSPRRHLIHKLCYFKHLKNWL